MKAVNYHADDCVLQIEGAYNNGLKTGLWQSFYKSGNVSAREHYLDGNLHGNFESFHENGNFWSTGNYNHGNKEGKFELFDQHGKLILVQHFHQNIVITETLPNCQPTTKAPYQSLQY